MIYAQNYPEIRIFMLIKRMHKIDLILNDKAKYTKATFKRYPNHHADKYDRGSFFFGKKTLTLIWEFENIYKKNRKP